MHEVFNDVLDLLFTYVVIVYDKKVTISKSLLIVPINPPQIDQNI